MRKVDYYADRVQFDLDPDKELYGIDPEFIQTLIYTKADAWAYEREWRVVADLTHQDVTTGFYFVDFGTQLILREIILGCRNSVPVGQIAKLVRGNPQQVRVCKARPAFHEFAMVENKRIKAINVPSR